MDHYPYLSKHTIVDIKKRRPFDLSGQELKEYHRLLDVITLSQYGNYVNMEQQIMDILQGFHTTFPLWYTTNHFYSKWDNQTIYITSYTVLCWALEMGYERVAHYLIDTFGGKCMPDKEHQRVGTIDTRFIERTECFLCSGRTALECACSSSPSVAIKLINTFREKCLPSHKDPKGQTAFYIACKKGNEEVATLLLDRFGEQCLPYETVREKRWCFSRKRTALYYTQKHNMTFLTTRLLPQPK